MKKEMEKVLYELGYYEREDGKIIVNSSLDEKDYVIEKLIENDIEFDLEYGRDKMGSEYCEFVI